MQSTKRERGSGTPLKPVKEVELSSSSSPSSSPKRSSSSPTASGTASGAGSGSSTDGSPVSPRARLGSRSTSLRSLMTGMGGMVMNAMRKKDDHTLPICKLCQQHLKEGESVCHCLIEEMYPNNKVVNQQIREKYLENSELMYSASHIDQHPEKLVRFVEEVYQLVEKTAIKEDLSPASMAKAKENLVNHLCTHLEEILVEE